MFVWKEKASRGRNGNASFARISTVKSSGAKGGERLCISLSKDFLEMYGLSVGKYLVIGYDEDEKRIGLVETKNKDRGYLISSSGKGSKGGKLVFGGLVPFKIDNLVFEKDEIFMENGIIIFELINKDIGSFVGN